MKNTYKVLSSLGFKKGEAFSSKVFVHLENKEKNAHLFLYKSLTSNSFRFSSHSGEWDGNIFDVITFYYNTDTSSNFNEADRIAIFLREFNLKESDLHFNDSSLLPISNFNLYKTLFQEFGNCKDDIFNNVLESETSLYFFFMNEDLTPARQENILGVVAYDKENKTETTVRFSNLDRSIYFTNPSIATNEAVVFNSFKEMIAFKERISSNYFYIVFKGSFNLHKAKTISLLTGNKNIQNTFLAFPDSLKGYYRDFEYLSVYADFEMREKDGFLKLAIHANSQSDIFIQKLKSLKKHIENELEKNAIKNLIKINAGKNLKGEAVFSIDIACIANIFKGFLVLASKYLLSEKNFKIIKPKDIYWAKERPNSKSLNREFKLNIYDTIGKIYNYY